MKKSIVFIFIFLISMVVLAPKVFLFEHLSHYLSTYDIVTEYESINEKKISLDINKATISWKSLKVLQSEKIETKLFGVYSSVTLSQSTSNFIKRKFQKIEVFYSIIQPLHVKIIVPLEEGKINGTYHLLNQKAQFHFKPLDEKKIPNFIKRFFKKSDKGYSYEFAP